MNTRIHPLLACVRADFALRALSVAGTLFLACSDGADDAGETAGTTAPSGAAAASGGGATAAAGAAGVAGSSGAGAGGQAGGAAGMAGTTMTLGGSGGMAGSSGAPASGSGGMMASDGGAAGGQAAIKSPGCSVAPVAAGDGSIDVDGMERTYIVELPEGYDENTPYPLILGFHGAGLNAMGFRGYFNLGDAAGNEAIIAYLDALGNPTGWQYERDVPFVDAALERLKSQYCIDEARVFATGHSSGGYFTNWLGCQRGDVFRAIAPVSGGLARSMCEGMPAVWIAHGNADDIVPTDEGRSARDYWAERNGCDTTMSTPVDPSPCVTYAGCDAATPVHYCEYDGEHGPPSFAVSALWAFFEAL